MRHGYVGFVPRPPQLSTPPAPRPSRPPPLLSPGRPTPSRVGAPQRLRTPMPAGTAARVIRASLRSVACGETTRPADPAAPRRLTDVRPVVGPLEHYVLGRPGGVVRTHLLTPRSPWSRASRERHPRRGRARHCLRRRHRRRGGARLHPRRGLRSGRRHPRPRPGPRRPHRGRGRGRRLAAGVRAPAARTAPVGPSRAGGPCAAPSGAGVLFPFPAGALSVARAHHYAPPARCAPPGATPALRAGTAWLVAGRPSAYPAGGGGGWVHQDRATPVPLSY